MFPNRKLRTVTSSITLIEMNQIGDLSSYARGSIHHLKWQPLQMQLVANSTVIRASISISHSMCLQVTTNNNPQCDIDASKLFFRPSCFVAFECRI